ncbi:UNVERIFIED_CONTAM: SIR2 family protein [Actinomycetes bacterium ARC8]|nr:SIR2 family protein [Actinomycetes bacterium ARC8]
MRITSDVDLPSKLIDAANDGSLVLFVGAGVSFNAPSNLPLFDGLAKQLASMQGVPFDEDVPPDAFVGQLCDRAPIIREQARAIISAPLSLPNATHHAIVRLASASPAFRIVTTNYDEHLTAAAAAAGINLGDVYQGPAVPLGRDFTGVVYLHGRVSRPAAEMVLTDDDFGRAYLTDGWARRFVQDLFMNRTVLFVGYSHNDSVMKYLARGLPPTTSRFALTEIPDDPKWNDLRITAVRYPDENEHVALTVALEAWAERLEMGQLDHRARVKEIVRGGPPKLPVEADYVAHALTSAAGVRAFAEEANGPAWLRWAEEQQVFKSLFGGGVCSADESRVLASWFVDRYVAEPDSADLALATIVRLGPVVCNELISEIARCVYFLGKTEPELARKWSTVILAGLRTHNADPEEIWLSPYGSAITGASAVPMLRRATRPRLVLTEDRPWFLAEASTEALRVKGGIAWSSSKSDVTKLWDAVREDLSTVAASVLQIFEQSLQEAYEVLEVFNGETAWDSWSFSRSAIEPHSQDRMRSFEDILIDGLRDTSMLLAAKDSSIMERWISGRRALFRRLGVHLLTEVEGTSNQDKLDTLLDRGWVFDRDLKHEVFRLLATIAAGLNNQDRERLLAQILEGPPPLDADDRTAAMLHQRSIFDVAEWLSRHVQGWLQLEKVLVDIRADRPDIGVREHPDFDHWMESGTWGGELPIDVDDFIEVMETDGAHEGLRQLMSRDYSERRFDEPTWDDALSLVRKVVAKRPAIGHRLLPAIELQNAEQGEDLISATIRGWSDATLSGGETLEALRFVKNLADRVALTQPISELCLSAVDEVETQEPRILEELDSLASGLWNRQAAAFEDCRTDDWLMLGLNTWPGFLAQYWINRIRLRWRAEKDDWQGLSEPEKTAISTMLSSKTAAGNPALAILAKDVFFLFAADESYTIANLFPIFEVGLHSCASQAWASYLHNPRANDVFLDAGFWRLLQSISADVSHFPGDHIDRQYWPLLASICIHSRATTVDRDHLIDLLTAQQSDAQIVSFINALADVLTEVDGSEAERAWNSWLRGTIHRRVQSPPGVQTLSERAAWGDLAVRSGTFMVEALQLSDSAPGPLGPRTTFDDIPESVLGTHSILLAEVVTHRIKATAQADWHMVHELDSLVPRLVKNSVDPAVLRSMAEAALRIGIHSAANWVN